MARFKVLCRFLSSEIYKIHYKLQDSRFMADTPRMQVYRFINMCGVLCYEKSDSEHFFSSLPN
jgi:hypothetical protein